MSMETAQLRREIVEVSQALDAAGLMPNKSGNVSVRSAGGFLITPSGVPYAGLTPAQMVELPLPAREEPASGPRASSEWRLHAAVYGARPDVAAIVHTHSPRATALACAIFGFVATGSFTSQFLSEYLWAIIAVSGAFIASEKLKAREEFAAAQETAEPLAAGAV